MNSMPLISVVIPVYNRSHMVINAIESALSQSYENREIIVVDDGSTDNTYDVLNNLQEDITIRHQDNRGPSSARNMGWNSCNGDYVLFLDSDDALEQDALYILYHALRKKEGSNKIWGASYGKKVTCNVDFEVIKTKAKEYYDGWVLPFLFFDNFIRTGTFLVRIEILEEIGGFREDFCVNEDLFLLFNIALRYKFVFVNEVVAKYRRHGGMRARQNKGNALKQGVKHIDDFFEDQDTIHPSILKAKDKIYSQEYVELAKIAWREQLYRLFLYHWRQAYTYRKKFFFHPKYFCRAVLAICFLLFRDKKTPATYS